MKTEQPRCLHDAELHRAWQDGSRQAGAALYGRYCERLTRLGRKLGLNGSDAQDFAHEALVEAMRASYEDRGRTSYWSWLSRIACRKAAAIPFERPDADYWPRRVPTPRGALSQQRLLDAIARMPEHQRVVFEHILYGLTPAEIAKTLAVDRSVVYMRVHRGRQWLRASSR